MEWHSEVVGVDGADELLRDAGPVVADWNCVKASVAMTMLAACRLAARHGESVLLSGLGSEEAFAGYQRHALACRVGSEASSGDRSLALAQMWHRDLQRDFAVATLAGVELRYPFLDHDLMELTLRLPAAAPSATREEAAGEASLLAATADGAKGALRAVAKRAGAPPLVYERRKRAAQYGSRFHYCLGMLAKKWATEGALRWKTKFQLANLIMSVPGASHGPVALLYTSGKDSAQAYCAFRAGHAAVCCVILPAGLDRGSDLSEAEAFARRAGLPLLDRRAVRVPQGARPVGSSEAEWAYDEAALLEAVEAARDAYGAESVACGHVGDVGLWQAVAQTCDRAGLRAYAPSWGNADFDPPLGRVIGDGCEVQVTRFPDASEVGRRVGSLEDKNLA